jgi:hypothetical protein
VPGFEWLIRYPVVPDKTMFRTWMVLTGLALGGMPLAAASSAGPPAEEPCVVSDLQHAADEVTTVLADDQLVVRVNPSRGFGRCTLWIPGGQWPERLAVCFVGLDELEAIEIMLGGLRVEGSRSRTGGFTVAADPAAPTEPSAAGPWRDSDTLGVVVTPGPEGMLVEFPAGFAAAAAGGPVRLSWVDWLRR